MIDKLVSRNLHGQDVIGQPLVKHVLGRRIVGIVHVATFAEIHVVSDNPLLQLLHSIRSCGVDALRSPELIGLAEEREAILTVFGGIGIGVTTDS